MQTSQSHQLVTEHLKFSEGIALNYFAEFELDGIFPAAPGCTGSLRKRTGKNGAFWACSRYPDCRQTASTESSAGGMRGGTRAGQRTRNTRRRKDRYEPTSTK
jgi:hypothetical protein